MPPSRRSYRAEERPRRRSPLRAVPALIVVAVLLGGVLLGVLVLNPYLAYLVPGRAGEGLYRLASGGRTWLERLVSDEGVLGGIRRIAEPYLSRIGLNLPTALLGLGLLLLAVVCIRILAVTSRPAEDEAEEAFLRQEAGGPAEDSGRNPYWPYDHRPSRRVTAGIPSGPATDSGLLPTGMAGSGVPGPAAPRVSNTEPLAPGEEAEGESGFPVMTTGDAWTVARPGSGPVPFRAPGQESGSTVPEPEPAPGIQAAPESFAEPAPSPLGTATGPGLAGEPAPGLGGSTGFTEPARPEPPGTPSSGEAAATAEPLPFEAPGPGPSSRPLSGSQPSFGAPSPFTTQAPFGAQPPLSTEPPFGAQATTRGAEGGYPSEERASQEYPSQDYPSEDYLGDMPEPAYARPAFRRFEEGPDRFGAAPVPQGPVPQGTPGEVWVESRPGLGTGLRKFAFPGFVLVGLGVASAYGLQTPYAAFITGGPYGQYLLVSAACVVSMAVSLWFMNGPMRATVRKMGPTSLGSAAPASGRPATGRPGPARPSLARPAAAPATVGFGAAGTRFGAGPARPEAGNTRPFRTVAPAPVPGRAALEGGLEAPDAVDWGTFPKPSIFIPWTQSGTSVGIDIGTAWTKVVQVGFSRDGLEIVNLGLCPTPEGAIGEDGISDPDLLGETLKDLLADRNIIQRQVTTALGGQGVIIRHVQFPFMTPEELREVLRWEAEHHIPIPPADAVVDFTVMPGQAEADERGNRQMRVMLVGAQKRVVEARVAALRKAKLVPKGVDAEALASYRVVHLAGHFVEDPLRYAQAIIDLGHSSTKLGIYLKGALEMSRTLGVGGRTFTTVLAERLRVPEIEAETLKRQYGVRPEGGRVLQALVPPLQDLMFEIRRSFEFFASRHFGQSVRHVYLVGGGARMPGIVEALSQYLNSALGERIPEGAESRVQIIDPLSALALSPRLHNQAHLIGPEFVTALGLALSEEEAADEG